MSHHAVSLASLSPAVVIHLVLALGALALGPLALLARKGSRTHRAFGYGWITLLLGVALSSVFIRRFSGLNWFGFTPIHILTIVTFVGIATGIWYIANGRVVQHRVTMWSLYLGACVTAGGFALLPGRLLGNLLWRDVLGIV